MTLVDGLLTAILWVSLALVAYAYAGYPLVLAALSRVVKRPPRQPVPGAEWPSVSILIAAYNEEHVIEERIVNLLAIDYPRDRLELVIASDGSSDRTVPIVQAHAADDVRVLDYGQRSGKANVLNRAMAEVSGDIVVLSDANTFMRPDAVQRLVRWFQDPEIGMVCGRLVLEDKVSGKNVDSVYWRYETRLKVWENALGALLGANGAIYAIRRALYPGLPPDTAVDDFVVPLLMRLRSGCRLYYERDAVAVEETAPDVEAEFGRRSRIGAGGFQSLGVLWPLLSPLHGWTAFALWSHKVLRWICPFFLVAALLANAVLAARGQYRLLLAAQIAFYTTAAVGHLLPPPPALSRKRERGRGVSRALTRVLRLPTMFVAMNLALLAGFWRWMRGRQKAVWQRTSRA